MGENLKFISLNDIRILEIQVTEKIKTKYEIDFIKTNLEISGIEPDIKLKFFYRFCQECLKYFVIYFYTDKSKEYFQFDIFKHLIKDKVVVVVYKMFFIIFYNKDIFFIIDRLQTLNKLFIDSFFQKKYNLKIDDVIYISPEEYKLLLDKPIKKRKIKNYLYWKKSLYFFIFILLNILYLINHYLFSVNIINDMSMKYKVQSLQLKLIKLKNSSNKLENISLKLIDIFKELNKYNILVEKFSYNNKKFYLSIYHKDWNVLLKFIRKSSLKINIKDFIKLKDKYIVVLEIV